jgi:hypothetical protein
MINRTEFLPLNLYDGIDKMILCGCGMAKRQTVRYEPQERMSSFVLRLPEKYAVALDGLVKKGAAKSRNELIVEIIERFISSLQKEAKKMEKNG